MAAAHPQVLLPRIAPAELDGLAEIVRRRGVRRIAYFHCDHFEPWRAVPGSRSVEENADDVIRFARASAANEHARRLTLFYKAHLAVQRVSPEADMVAVDGDVLGFQYQSAATNAAFERGMRGLVETVGHDVQIHIHHEHFTYNTGPRDPALAALLASPQSRERDSARFELALKLSLDAIRAQTRLRLDRWFFVHGVWALNASDPDVCHITDELQILRRHGCRGDFTFPAGRPLVDPFLDQPYFVYPIDAPRAYDLPEAEPERAFGNAAAAGRKLFIWASKLGHQGASIDTFTDRSLEALDSTVSFARQVLGSSFVADGTLWFKTHAHSMHPRYFEEGRRSQFPHDHPLVQRMIGTVLEAASWAGAEVSFATASEVYAAFVQPRRAPEQGFALEVRGKVRDFPVAADAAPVRLRAEIDRVAAEVVTRAVARAGVAGSGASDTYAARAARGGLLLRHELAVADVVLQHHPRLARAYEFGSGLSVLTMLIAANGVPATGFDRVPARVDLAREILGALTEATGASAAPCEIWWGAAPKVMRTIVPDDAAILFTNVTGTVTPEDEAEIIALAGRFRLVVIDLARFLRARDAAEQQALSDRLVAAGWGEPWQLPSQPTYRVFVRSAPIDEDDD